MNGTTTTRFKGFNIGESSFEIDKFTCKSKLNDKKEPCSNFCEIRRVQINGEKKPFFYGGRCEKFEVSDRKGKGKDIPNYFHERMNLLMGTYRQEEKNGRITIGIPRGLTIFYQQFSFWRTFFQELGFHLVLSSPSNRQIVKKSLELLNAETCFPIEVMHGHMNDLLEKEVDYIFAPFVVNQKAAIDNPTNNCNCPWIQSYPFMVKSALGPDKVRDKILMPTLHFRYFDRVLFKELSQFMKDQFGLQRSKVVKAIHLADEAQAAFEEAVAQRGQEVLANLPAGKRALVIVGRPYNTNDPELNLSMVEKLIHLDTIPIPIDFLPLKEERIYDDYSMMYWPNGGKIIASSRIIARDDRLNLVYMGNFRCGPDSFLSHYVREEMKGKPYLQIEVDEHSADAGMITRYEAFLDSLKGFQEIGKRKEAIFRPGSMRSSTKKGRVLYIPYMCDSAHSLAAAVRSCGGEAEVLPLQTEEDIELGRKHTSSRECFPMICTTGSFLKKLMEPGIDPKRTSFFMPDHNGPCRFGQYNKFQRIIFDRLGYTDAEIISPGNDGAYGDISGGSDRKLRFRAWKGFVAIDMLRKMLQERKPYEVVKGETNKVYQRALNAVIASIEGGAGDLADVLEKAAGEFTRVQVTNGTRKPVVAIVGEIFMRDNPFCSGGLVQKLEDLGAETVIAPFSEWITYSTYRYTRDSKWKGDIKGVFKSKIQEYSQKISAHKLHKAVHKAAELQREIPLEDRLTLCDPYIHKDYDGDPAMALGGAVGLAKTGVSGFVNILPFACMPGTLVQSLSHTFRKDHENVPWENIAYDGQDNAGIETRLQAFIHQAKEFGRAKGNDKPENWHLQQPSGLPHPG